MTDRGGLRRVELAVSLLGITIIAAAAPVTVDGFRFHLEHFLGQARGVGSVDADCIVAIATACISTIVVSRFLLTMVQQDFRRRRALDGLAITQTSGALSVFQSRRVEVFTAGLIRPRIYVSSEALVAMSRDALTAILEHEACHVRRRDPLRVALAQSAATALGWIPGVAPLATRQVAVGELAADAYAVSRLGQPQSLAQAMLQWEGHGADSGLLPQRVDQLTGELRCEPVSGRVVGLALVVLVFLAAVLLAMVLTPSHPATFCTVAAALLTPVIALPAVHAARRAGRILDLA